MGTEEERVQPVAEKCAMVKSMVFSCGFWVLTIALKWHLNGYKWLFLYKNHWSWSIYPILRSDIYPYNSEDPILTKFPWVYLYHIRTGGRDELSCPDLDWDWLGSFRSHSCWIIHSIHMQMLPLRAFKIFQYGHFLNWWYPKIVGL